MSTLLSFFPILIGISIVAQSGLNRRFSELHGLSTAVLTTALVFLVLAGGTYAYFARAGMNAEPFRLRWWFLIPGAFGYLIVVGTPWAIGRWGAAQTVVLIIASQMLTALLWDRYFESRPFNVPRVVGMGLAWLGAWVSTRG